MQQGLSDGTYDNCVVQAKRIENLISGDLRLETLPLKTRILSLSGREEIWMKKNLKRPATCVPDLMRQIGMRGAIFGASEEAYAGADRESASAD